MPTIKTRTSPSGLTPDEQKEIERRGFLVKEYFSYWNLLTTSLLHFGSFFYAALGAGLTMGLSLALNLSVEYNWGIFFVFMSIAGFFALRTFFYYIFLGKLFYTNEGVFIYSQMYEKVSDIKSLEYVSWILNYVNKSSYSKASSPTNIGGSAFKWIILLLPIIVPLYMISVGAFSLGFNWHICFFILELLAIPIGIIITLRQLVEHLHPLYAFGNLGSKIQSLTPRITEESQKIEKEFSTDMNFRVLSDSFDTLAKDFSQISSYVIKLETIEKKANKGNLFDSEKYIGSLREDIVKPLISLRSFLEKKKTELEKSKEEIRNLGALDAETSSAGQKVRVRVGGAGNGETENLELQSKRSEPLRAELTENIAKLDVMIEKFGKI